MKYPFAAATYAVLVLIATPAIAGSSATSSPRWDKTPFAATASQLRAAAQKAAKGHDRDDVVRLLIEQTHTFDAQRRRVYQYREIFYVRTHKGAKDWSSLQWSWAPWYQAQPKVRIRVLDMGGSFHELDPATVSVTSSAGALHRASDRSSLRAPVASIQKGTIVEEVVIARDLKPEIAAGKSYSAYLGSSIPTLMTRLIIDAPASLSLVQEAQLVKRAPKRTRRKGRVRWVYEIGPQGAESTPEKSLPPNVPAYAQVRFGVGGSWSDVASQYGVLVDRQIAAGSARSAGFVIKARSTVQETLNGALSQLRAHVRSTNQSLGVSTLVPWSPAETWRRGYGDAKDLATLLVSALRDAGYGAHVVLTSANSYFDVSARLPGMHFGYALVRATAPGSRKPIWLDPNTRNRPAGQVIEASSGRRALVVSSATKTLTRVPTTSARDNLTTELRQLFLRDSGAARIVATTTSTGVFGASMRREYRGGKNDALEKSLREYTKDRYSAAMESYRFSNPRDLNTRQQLIIEAKEASSFALGFVSGVMVLKEQSLLSELPQILRVENDTQAKLAKERKADLFLDRVFTYEVAYEIHLPAGFAAKNLLQSLTRKLGVVTVTREVSRGPGLVKVVLRLSVDKRRLTAKEVRATRAAVIGYWNEEALSVEVEHEAMALHAANKSRDALVRIDAAIRAAPKKPANFQRKAKVLVESGLRDPAVAAAKRAVALKRSADHLHLLGWVLSHDELGRIFTSSSEGSGLDLSEAVNAYRAALVLEPKRKDSAGALAFLLEFDSQGCRYHRDLTAAVTAHEYYRSLGGRGYEGNLLALYVFTGRWKSVRKLATTMSDSSPKSSALVAAAAALDGIAAAKREAERLTANAVDAADVLGDAGYQFLLARDFKLVAQLINEAVKGGATRGYVLAVQKKLAALHKVDLAAQKRDPRRVVVRLLAQLTGVAKPVEMARFFAKSAIEVGLPESRDLLGGVREQFSPSRFSPASSLDLLVSFSELTSHPERWAYRLEHQGAFPGISRIFVVREKDRYRLVTSGKNPAPLAAQALRMLRRKNIEAARQWLDWANYELDHGATTVGASLDAFRKLWTIGKKGTATEIELAAASLLIVSDISSDALELLKACPRDSSPSAVTCNVALFWAANAVKDASVMRDTYTWLESRSVGKATAREMRSRLALVTGDWSDVQAHLATALKKDPTDLDSLLTDALARCARGTLFDCNNRLARLSSLKPSRFGNTYAWQSLLIGEHDDGRLVAARASMASAFDKAGESGALNTIAAVQADRGELREAYSNVLGSLERAPKKSTPGPEDWLVMGRIAAGYGYTDLARKFYARVPVKGFNLGMQPHELAALWRSQLP